MEVIKNFIDKGYEVHIVAKQDRFSTHLIEAGCVFHPVAFKGRSRNVFFDIRLYFQLKSIYQKINPALIFHYFIKMNFFGSLAANRLRFSSVAFVAGLGYAFSGKNLKSFVAKKLYSFCLKKIKTVVFLNAADRNFFVQNKMILPNQSKLLKGEGVDTIRFSNHFISSVHKQPFQFFMASRLIKSKGVELFVEATKMLKQKGYVFESHVAGFFPEDHPDCIAHSKMQNWVNDKIIHYHGFEEDIVNSLKQADCFVLPSFYHEGAPRSIMEASSMGLPVIASSIPGCLGLVDDAVTGLLFETRNSKDLGDKMEKILLMSEKELRQMGECGRKKMQAEFDIRYTVQAYEALVSNMLFTISPKL